MEHKFPKLFKTNLKSKDYLESIGEILFQQSSTNVMTLYSSKQQLDNQSRFKDLSITLGSILLPYAVKFINLLIRLIEKFQALSPRTQKIVLILAALAAILPPILITIGLMASGISALVSGFGLFAIAATGVASVIKLISIAMRANPIGIMITLIAAAIIYWKDLGKMIDNIVNKIKNINFGKIGKFFGIESGKIIHKSVLQQTSIPKQTSINQRQDVNVGDQLDINFGNMPKGTNTKFTPIRQNSLPVGLNSVYGGA